MSETTSKRATVYFDPDVYEAIRLKAARTHRSMSNIINDAVRLSLREDQVDFAAFEARATEPVISYVAMLKKLKVNGKL
ncbi:MAG: ribbon-helix-helix protein, CopG family [Blastocatellales bacterium]